MSRQTAYTGCLALTAPNVTVPGHQHRIDHVHRRVGGVNSATYQTGVVDHEVVAGAYHRQVGTLQGLMGAVDPARTRLAGYHVVGQDAAEQLGVSLELIDSTPAACRMRRWWGRKRCTRRR